SLVDSFNHVFSKRNLQWNMGFLYPGLAMRVSPSSSQGGALEFVLDPHREAQNIHSLKEAGTGRLLTRQFLVPFLLGFKFNAASLIPILFGVLALLAKKALIISKIALVVTSALALGSLLLGNGNNHHQQYYGSDQYAHHGYLHSGGVHGYTRYPEDDAADSFYRGIPEQQADQLNVYPNIAKSLDRSQEEEKSKGRNFAWEEKGKKLNSGIVMNSHV
ncbi:hypothetical protein JTB14_011664, partial [Gonioctena quinquepunctata]